MPQDFRANAGMSGAIGLPGSPDALFQVRVYAWSRRSKGQFRQRMGRGLDGLVSYRWLYAVRSLVVRWELRLDAAPEPASWAGAEYQLTLQAAPGKTVSFNVIVEEVSPNFNEIEKNTWAGTFTALITSEPQYNGWEQESGGDDPNRQDIELYEGSSITIDADDLETAQGILIDWWDGEVDDTAEAEVTKLLAIVAANSGATADLKPNPATIKRDAPDGGTIFIPFRRTTPAERILNSATTKSEDPNALTSHETTAAFNATPGSGTIAGLVLRRTGYTTYNDGNTLRVKELGVRSTVEDITLPGTAPRIANNGIGSDASEVRLYDATTPISPVVSLTVGTDQKISTTAVILFPGANLPSNIAAVITRAGTDSTGTGASLALTRGTVNGVANAISAIVVTQGTLYTAKPLVTFTGTGLLLPQTAATHKLKTTSSRPVKLTNAGIGELQWTFAGADDVDREQLPGTSERINKSGIGSTYEITLVDCAYFPTTYTASDSSVLSIREVLKHPIVTDQTRAIVSYLYRAIYAPLTTAEAIEHGGTSATANNVAPQPATIGMKNIETVFTTVSATLTQADLGLAAQTSYFNTAGYERVAVTKLDKTHAQMRITRINDDLTILESPQTTRKELTTTLAGGNTTISGTLGFSGTGAAVIIADRITVGTGIYKDMLGEFEQWVSYGTVVIRRRKIGISAFAAIKALMAPGTVNAVAFLGYAPGTLMYIGDSQRTSLQAVIEGQNHTQIYDLHFQFRSVGYWTDSGIPVGRWFLTTSTHTIGATPAVSALKTGWSVGTVPSATFSSLIA